MKKIILLFSLLTYSFFVFSFNYKSVSSNVEAFYIDEIDQIKSSYTGSNQKQNETNSENFAPVGTKWYYNQEIYPEFPGEFSGERQDYISLESVRDTIIQEKKFNRIKLTHGLSACYFIDEVFLNQSNYTVYFFSELSKDIIPLYIWSAQKGDKWEVKMSDNENFFTKSALTV